MTSSPLLLPCRPKIFPDEWVETYLVRLARTNGIQFPTRGDIELFRSTLPATARSKCAEVLEWGSITLPSQSFVKQRSKIRYCPACMEQSKYIRARWRLAMFEVCTIHNIRLKDDVFEPAITGSYKQKKRYPLSEVTSDRLWEGAACPMPSERQYVGRTWSSFERSILECDLERAANNLACAIIMEALLDTLVRVEYGKTLSETYIQRAVLRADLVMKYKYSITATPAGIENFLEQITNPSQCLAVLGYLQSLFLQELRSRTCLSSVPIAKWIGGQQLLKRIHEPQRKYGKASLDPIPLPPE